MTNREQVAKEMAERLGILPCTATHDEDLQQKLDCSIRSQYSNLIWHALIDTEMECRKLREALEGLLPFLPASWNLAP